MPWVHACLVAKRKQHRSNGADEGRVVAAGKIGAANGAGEQRVAHEQIRSPLAWPSHFKAHTARTVPRRMVRTHFILAERNLLAWPVETVDWREVGVHVEAKQQSLFDGLLVEEEIVAMQMNR